MRIDKRLFPVIIVAVFVTATLVAFLAGLRPGHGGREGAMLGPTLIAMVWFGGARA